MAFYSGAIVREPAMENPTIVVLTDRNDLDDQLFTTFSRCQDLLRQPPAQAESRADLRSKLSVNAGGVIFTTIQKFFPEERGDTYPTLSERRNIVVIADEAHRSQYDFIDGFARHNARRPAQRLLRRFHRHAHRVAGRQHPGGVSATTSASTTSNGLSKTWATVPIHYESRLARLQLDESERPTIDPDFEEATEGEEIERKERLKTKWAQLEGRCRRRKPRQTDCRGHRGPLRAASGSAGRESDGGVHEPAHLR